jgi:amidase
VTRSVRDSAVLLDIICQPMGGDPYWLDPPARPFAEEVGRDPGALRIAFTTAALNSAALDPECVEAVRSTARLCASLGHEVEEAQPPGDFASLANSAGVVVAANVATTLDNEARRRGKPIAEGEVEAATWALYQRGLTIVATPYIQALQAVHAFGREMARFFENWDILLLSTLGKPAIPVGGLRGDPSDSQGFAERLFAFMPNTQPFNLTGQPAMSVPLCSSKTGLPIGIQFVGRPAGEGMLFRLAAQLEAASPWKDRRPTGVAW